MKFVALVSGGKDSMYSIIHCIKNGHELVGCVHLGAPSINNQNQNQLTTEVSEAEESYMYQTAGSEVVQAIVEQCIGVPFIYYQRQHYTSTNTSLQYSTTSTPDEHNTDNNTKQKIVDEVDDMYYALCKAQQSIQKFDAVCCGAILSTYQRIRVEDIVCNRLQLISLSYLWRKNTQYNLLNEMIYDTNMKLLLVRVASSPGLQCSKHLLLINSTNNTNSNNSTRGMLSADNDTLLHYFYKLYKLYHFQLCGEGGEYESIVLDCCGDDSSFDSLYKYGSLVIDKTIIVEDTTYDGCGSLYIQQYHIQPKIGYETNPMLVVVQQQQSSKKEHANQQDQPLLHDHGSNRNTASAQAQQNNTSDCSTLRINESSSINNNIDTDTKAYNTITTSDETVKRTSCSTGTIDNDRTIQKVIDTTTENNSNESHSYLLPHVRTVSGGLIAISEISSQLRKQPEVNNDDTKNTNTIEKSNNIENNIDDTTIIEDAKYVFTILQLLLQQYNCTQYDVICVHICIIHMSYFTIINTIYKQFFGTILPPTRCCISLCTKNDTNSNNNNNTSISYITLDCWVLCGSGQYLRTVDSSIATTTTKSTTTTTTSSELEEQKTISIYNNTNRDHNTKTCNPYTIIALANNTFRLRRVLHVQSISYWAPVCIGPYSQVNTIRDSIHCIAGQIGLIPETMKLISLSSWQLQLRQCYLNLTKILDSLNGASLINNLLSCVLYVNDTIQFQKSKSRTLTDTDSISVLDEMHDICLEQIRTNCNIIPGLIDDPVPDPSMDTVNDVQLYNGYEDEGTMLELTKGNSSTGSSCGNHYMDNDYNDDNNNEIITSIGTYPILVVSIQSMPMDALVELDTIASTIQASKSLQRNDTIRQNQQLLQQQHARHCEEEECTTKSDKSLIGITTSKKFNWDTGHDFYPTIESPSFLLSHINNNETQGRNKSSNNNGIFVIDTYIRTLGSHALSFATIVASYNPSANNNNTTNNTTINSEQHKSDDSVSTDTTELFLSMLQTLKYDDSVFDVSNLFQIRLFYLSSSGLLSSTSTDSKLIRNNLYTALTMLLGTSTSAIPAITIAPVNNIHILNLADHAMKKKQKTTKSFMLHPKGDDDHSMDIVFALQAIAFDPIHTETEMWINQKR